MKRALQSYSKKPFAFAWASFLYVVLLLAFLFAALGIGIIYFIAMSVLKIPVAMDSLPTLAVAGLIVLVFMFFSNGLNAALAKAYRGGLWKEKTTLVGFFSYAVEKSLPMFAIMLVRDFVWLILVGPVIAIYVLLLNGVAFVDLIVYGYILFATFVIHMAFTPAFLYCGALGAGLVGSFKSAMKFLAKKNIYFFGGYIVFALLWILNFIPFIQVFTIFFFYPIVYSAMIAMAEGGARMESDDDD